MHMIGASFWKMFLDIIKCIYSSKRVIQLEGGNHLQFENQKADQRGRRTTRIKIALESIKQVVGIFFDPQLLNIRVDFTEKMFEGCTQKIPTKKKVNGSLI